MTYNFDVDRWYDNEKANLDRRRASGALDEAGYREALEELDRRYEEMVQRLDGTYRIPPSASEERDSSG
jgi:hypothetical protein